MMGLSAVSLVPTMLSSVLSIFSSPYSSVLVFSVTVSEFTNRVLCHVDFSFKSSSGCLMKDILLFS